MNTTEIVRNFYNKGVQYEWERLERHPIEFEVTKHYLDKYIKSGDKVLDIGGGSGRYTLYLAENGCDVTLFDLSDENVSFAINKAKEMNLNIKALQGDACEVYTVLDESFDHILLMGPMYHLLDEVQRTKALEAALKLLKPNGIIYVSFISLFAGVCYYMKNDPQLVFDTNEQEYIKNYLENKTYCGDAFTKACFIAPKDVLPFMSRFALEKLHLFGQESITSPCENNIYACDKNVIKRWTELAIATCEREEFLSYSEHLMYIGRLGLGGTYNGKLI